MRAEPAAKREEADAPVDHAVHDVALRDRVGGLLHQLQLLEGPLPAGEACDARERVLEVVLLGVEEAREAGEGVSARGFRNGSTRRRTWTKSGMKLKSWK